MNDDDTIKAEVRRYVGENWLVMRQGMTVGDDESLLLRGVIDSLGVVDLVSFVEQRWDIKVDAPEIVEANFGTFNAIARFVHDRVRSVGLG